MCGRVPQTKNPTENGSMLKVDFTKGLPNTPAHYNGAPGQDYLIARIPLVLGASEAKRFDTTESTDCRRLSREAIFGMGRKLLISSRLRVS